MPLVSSEVDSNDPYLTILIHVRSVSSLQATCSHPFLLPNIWVEWRARHHVHEARNDISKFAFHACNPCASMPCPGTGELDGMDGMDWGELVFSHAH
ncbi:uncharacterized protein TRAVEDRAFT_50342 [Trametes versicolor FP-101664 SS1]|uniref:uncharacterized protein n=1 Tax=Trametes versicolor (strain FP-101664) TaxID=717944 RepID=UPI0004622020|nr:uncharacterized protein TRAVEDRAFT_50342 [Trametes versicolor FP-101664 SS1]EIW55859.1 hypothetical protein TRAVEDRAFT_50342 [Trametes versicolor FP-101664 SS1]